MSSCMEERDEVGVVMHLIDCLPETQRQVIMLRDVDDCSYEEIETTTGLSAGNVRVLLSRARKTIREQFNAIVNHECR